MGWITSEDKQGMTTQRFATAGGSSPPGPGKPKEETGITGAHEPRSPSRSWKKL